MFLQFLTTFFIFFTRATTALLIASHTPSTFTIIIIIFILLIHVINHFNLWLLLLFFPSFWLWIIALNTCLFGWFVFKRTSITNPCKRILLFLNRLCCCFYFLFFVHIHPRNIGNF